MNTGLRKHKSATLRVAVPEALPQHMQEGVREILSVQCSNPKKGHATRLLREVCAEADRSGTVLMLEARAFDDGMDDAQLKAWYMRSGFVQTQESPIIMARRPRDS